MPKTIDIDDIKQKISMLDEAMLKHFVINLYQEYPELNTAIETLVLYNDPAALAKAILKRIQSVSRGRKYIDWQASAGFSRNLDLILKDIEDGLLECAPKQAYDLMTKFLATSNKVMNRIDSSSGDIGFVYSDAVLLWLKAANAFKESSPAGAEINWLELIYELHLKNDYGVFDTLLSNSALLLSHNQLTQLAWRYEAELKQAVKTEGESGYQEITKLVSLLSVAEALKDPKLYERAALISSPTLNDLQKIDVVKKYLQFNQVDEALRWLNTSWDTRFESDKLRLLDKAYEQVGDKNALKQTRFKIYQGDKCFAHFMLYSECLNEDEKKAARIEAIQLAEQGDDLAVNIDLLLQLNETERAQSLVLAAPQSMADIFYTDLLKLAKQFDKQQCWLAATACYRVLLLDILIQARSKAYTHAVRYYKKLILIAEKLEDYEILENHIDFMQQLKAGHGRKTSFWSRVL